jgi:outer membrane protein OmpA-like peptidoglycan-associated protein
MRKYNLIVLILFGLLLSPELIQAQTQAEMRFLKPTASLTGNTGLWKIQSPVNLGAGNVAFSAWGDRINRNPGRLTITTYGFGGAVGLTNWLEMGVNLEVNRRVLVGRQSELSLGQQELAFFGSRLPGAPPSASELVSGSSMFPQLRDPATPAGALSGDAGYYHAVPFAGRLYDGPGGNGVGTIGVGFKINLLSEANGHSLDMGVRPYANIPTHRSAEFLRHRPSQSGAWIYGADFLLGKNVADAADIYFNLGYRAYGSPDGGNIVTLSDVIPLGFGLAIPRDTRVQVMAEILGDVLVGDETPNEEGSVVDGTVGFRAFFNRYLNLSAGYRRPFNQSGGDKNGFVFQLGFTYGPPMDVTPPSPPSLSCSANPSQVTVGQLVELTASGSSSTGAALTYDWGVNAGTIQGSGQTVQVNTTGVAPGSYIATVRASEATTGLFADCTARFTVVAPPMNPPTASCSANPNNVQIGEAVNLTVQASSPDGRPLTYQWTTTSGSIVGTGNAVRLDTTGASPGTITARAEVRDDRGLSANCTASITATAPPPPPPPPAVVLLDTCQFAQNSARVDNVCKAKLDSIALRLQNEPDASLAIVGFAAGNEQNGQQLSQARADNVRAYLSVDRGIAQGRLTSRTGAAGTGAEARKVEMHLVPRGATFVGYNVELERIRAAQSSAPDSSDRRIIATLQ